VGSSEGTSGIFSLVIPSIAATKREDDRNSMTQGNMKEVTPAPPCTMHSHYLLIRDTDAERCPNCGRKLWRRPPTKCERHSVYACSECFSPEQFFNLRFGPEPISEVELQEEDDEND